MCLSPLPPSPQLVVVGREVDLPPTPNQLAQPGGSLELSPCHLCWQNLPAGDGGDGGMRGPSQVIQCQDIQEACCPHWGRLSAQGSTL